MKTQKIFFLLDFLTNQLNKKKNSFLLHNKPGLEKKEQKTKDLVINKNTTNPRMSFLLYNNLNVVKELLQQPAQKKTVNNTVPITTPASFTTLTTLVHSYSTENINYRKVYQSLYLKQIPLQLTQLSITTTPHFKDNLTFSGEKTMRKTSISQENSNFANALNSNLFYNLFLKSYATNTLKNEKTSSKKNKERTTKSNSSLSSSDHIAYNLNTLDSIKNSNLNFSNILIPLSFFLKKKRQIVLINKNVSNKKIKKLYYNWYKIQLTRRYLNYINNKNIDKNGIKKFDKKKTNENKNLNFYLVLKNEHTKINKLKFLKKSLKQYNALKQNTDTLNGTKNNN